jgi:hypothetical protein
MGHKRIDETMLYVQVADDHMRPIPPEIENAALGENDQDRRIIKMLGARGDILATPQHCVEKVLEC